MKDTVKTAVQDIFFEEPEDFVPPPEVVVNSEEELLERLAESERDVKNGLFYTEEEFFERLRIKYGI